MDGSVMNNDYFPYAFLTGFDYNVVYEVDVKKQSLKTLVHHFLKTTASSFYTEGQTCVNLAMRIRVQSNRGFFLGFLA